MVEQRIIDLGIDSSPKPIILVVDDESNVQSLINDSLSEDYRIVSAFNGREGITKAKNVQPELIIMDVMMPDMGGFEAVRELQNDSETQNIPVLVFSAQDFDPSTVDVIKSEKNVVGFITKPFRTKALRETVRLAIQKRLG